MSFAVAFLVARRPRGYITQEPHGGDRRCRGPGRPAARVTHAGGRLARGDTVEVTGVLHRACPQHGGDLDLHATRLEVLTTGGRPRPR